jgi:Ca2+-binding RTX toxin-like protein
MLGNSGNNTLKGGACADLLDGNKGTDKLFGGADADIFHFTTGDGKDTVMDFELGFDKLDLSGWAAMSSIEDVLNNHAVDKGADLLISAGSDSLLIKNVHKADFDALDFTDF